MAKLNAIVVVIFVALLIGCGSTREYLDPDAEPVSMSDRIIAQWGRLTPNSLPPVNAPLNNPDINLVFTDAMIKKLVTEFLVGGLRIPLKNSKLSGLDRSYLELHSINQFSANKAGTIYIGLQGKAVLKGVISQKTIRVKNMGIQVAPRIEIVNGRYFVKALSIVSYLDIEKVPPDLDKALANLANELLNSEKFSDKLRFDVTRLVIPKIKHPFRNEQLKLFLKKVGIVIQENQLIIQAKR